MKKMHGLVRYLGICDGNIQEGSFRCDANVSVRPKGQQAFVTRTEIKNINSFKFVEPDLLPVLIYEDFKAQVKAQLPD